MRVFTRWSRTAFGLPGRDDRPIPFYFPMRNCDDTFFGARELAGVPDDDARAAQWRVCVLELSHSLTRAATTRPALAVILLEAFDCALEQLLLFGREDDLRALENWLAEKN